MSKIFCLSLQRSGTKSFGQFAQNILGLNLCSWKESSSRDLSEHWYRRDLQAIYSFIENECFQAFEDSPWWHGDLYKFLPHRYPDAKFICLHRPAADWFGSMQRHSQDHLLGNTIRHCEIYQRSFELMQSRKQNKKFKQGSKTMRLSSSPQLYLNYHFNYHSEMKAWFKFNNLSDRLFMHPLYSVDWNSVANFTGIKPRQEIGDEYSGIFHKSNKKKTAKFSNPI